MFKQLKFPLLAVFMVAFLGSCQQGNQDVRNAAREDVATNSVQPQSVDPSAVQEPAVPAGPTTSIEFEETTFDFGTVDEGEKVSHTFKFKNTGNEPLIFSNAKGSCGCTVPTWPREPIAVGATGIVSVEFNSKNKKGKRNQKVTLTGNTNPPQTFIYLTGNVNPAEGGEGAEKPQIQVSQ
ncbi:MAG: DUF1573 domain-containing protein [Saprospiraceae bacterium]|nr:DUF1573 domain-containing protein [Saprospiraceae bacterium]MCB9323392.1 DUF1573 domain-containing protein [Lewinellaceae bacterium]